MERLALLAILILAPHTKLPGTELAYLFRPADLIIIFASLTLLRWSPTRPFTAAVAMLWYFAISMASTIWGVVFLHSQQLATTVQEGAIVSYLPFAIKKLVLIATCFLGFQFIAGSRAVRNEVLLQAWFTGLAIAVGFHVLCNVISDNYFVQRAGVFVEGNHGGSYYLLSFFLMWWSRQAGLSFARKGMFLAFTGILLTQSTTSLILIMPLSVIAYLVMLPPSRGRSVSATTIALALLAVLVVAAVFGGEIMAKLTDEDVGSASFSRYDRLASIASGMEMFLAYPWFGIGIQGYAFALPNYVDPFIETFFDWNSRRIANNIYVELLAEQGGIGISAMLLVLLRIGYPIFRHFRRHVLLCAAMLSVLLSWLAFPTYTISFHWIGLAMAYRLSVQGVTNPRTKCAANVGTNPQDLAPLS